MKIALIGVAGAVGTVARYLVGQQWGGRDFPWATLAINTTGSLLLGFVLKVGLDRSWSTSATVPLSVGLLGGFTTFSTFSYETQSLLREGRVGSAGLYVGASVVAGVVAAAVGYGIASTVA